MATAPSSLKCCGGGDSGSWIVQAIMMIVVTGALEPWDLAFALFVYATLALLFLCLSMYERLPPVSQEEDDDGTKGKRRWRLKMAVWALSTSMSVAFAWRVAKVMPAPALKAAVWCMTSAVVIAGFYLLFAGDPSLGIASCS